MSAKNLHRAKVLNDLRAGYGVEDIALRLSIPVEVVRTIVADLRADGILADLDWRASA